MNSDAAAALRRLLHTIPTLSDGRPRSIDAVARLAGTDRATVLEDLFSLSDRFGDPGGFVPGLSIFIESRRGVRLDANRHFRRPMGLSIRELYALDLGLAMLRMERPTADQAVIDRTRDRLRRFVARVPATETPSSPWAGDLAATVDPDVFATLRRSLREGRRVRLTYRRADAEEARARVVCPYGLVAARGAWYIIAHCVGRDALRVFRMDRVEAAKLLAARYRIPDTFSLDSVARNGRVLESREPQSLVVRYSPRIARWIAERERVALDADGSVTIAYALADEQWAVRHALQYGPDAEVLSPVVVREAIRERIARILK